MVPGRGLALGAKEGDKVNNGNWVMSLALALIGLLLLIDLLSDKVSL